MVISLFLPLNIAVTLRERCPCILVSSHADKARRDKNMIRESFIGLFSSFPCSFRFLGFTGPVMSSSDKTFSSSF